MARVLSFVVLVLLCATPTAQAGILTWRFSGFVEDSILADVPVGTPISFDVRIDTAAADSCPEDGSGFFQGPGSDMQVGSHRYTSDWTSFEVNNPLGNCIAMPGASTLRLLLFDGGGFSSASIGFPFWAAGDVLPEAPPPGASTYFFMGRHGFSSDVSGSVAFVLVPEPQVLTLAALGLLGALLHRRRG